MENMLLKEENKKLKQEVIYNISYVINYILLFIYWKFYKTIRFSKCKNYIKKKWTKKHSRLLITQEN